jgi:hypothetical protein
MAEFLQTLADRTAGCSVEQLEQIYRELMDEIWKTRHEWNRMTVLSTLMTVFNDTIGDIELVQGALMGAEKKSGKEGEVLDSVEGGMQSQSQSQEEGGEKVVEEPWVYLR